MRNYSQDYPGFVNPPDAAFPQGSPKNATTDTAEDGTPVEEKWVGDLWGFLQSVMADAGETPNGQTESVSNPQVLNALKKSIGAPARAYANATSSRAFGVPEVNNTGSELLVSVNDNGAGAGVSLQITINGTTYNQVGGGSSPANIRRATGQFTVPIGATYEVNAIGGGVLEFWSECGVNLNV